MGPCIVGVDGGGTKSDGVIVDLEGYVKGRFSGGPANYQALGKKGVREALDDLFRRGLEEAGIPKGDIACIVLGMAGVGRAEDEEVIAEVIRSLGWSCRVLCCSDALVALVGAFGNGPGIILIAGTGSICLGRDEAGNLVRCGGWGYLLDDVGSGYFIGQQAVVAGLRAWDGRGKQTRLRSLVEERFGLRSIEGVVRKIYIEGMNREATAGLAPMVFAAADGGDEVAQEIVERAGRGLGEMVKTVAVELGWEGRKVRVSYAGGVFERANAVIPWIHREVAKVSEDVEISPPRFEPSVGAALLGFQELGECVTEGVLKHLALGQERKSSFER